MHASSDLSFPLEQFQHLPNPYYPHDALRDSLVRTNIVNLDLASPPPPQRTHPRSHPLTPPDTPGVRRNASIHVHHVHHDEDNEDDEKNNEDDLGLKRSTLDRFLALGLLVNSKRNPTRYLVVGGVPPTAPTPMLSRVFCRMGALKGMFVRYQQQGIVVLSWHDLRDAKKALTLLTTNALFNMEEPLSAAFITPFNLIKSTGESLFVNPKEGNITITAEQPAISNTIDGERKAVGGEQDGDQKLQEQQQQQPISLHAALALFGELSTFSVNESVGSTTYFASYYDAREAANAAKSLHGRSILGMHIRVAEGFPQDKASNHQGHPQSHPHPLPLPLQPLQPLQPQQPHQPQPHQPQKEGTQSQLHPALGPRSPAATPEKKLFGGKFDRSSERTPPSPLHTQSSSNSNSNSSSDSDDAAGTPHAPTNSPVATKLPPPLQPSSLSPSASLNVRPASKATSRGGLNRTPPNAKPASANVNVNVPIYSTPPGPAPRLRTTSTSSGNLMVPSGSPTTNSNTLSPPPHMHLVNRTVVPPRLSLPWLQGSIPAPVPVPGGQVHYEDGASTAMAMQFNGGGNGPLRQHPPTLGPGAYIHSLDNTPHSQPVAHRVPYAYKPPQNFGPAPGVGHRFPTSSNNSAAPGSVNENSPTSAGSAHHHPHHPSPHSRKHTLSTSTSTSASISTSMSTGTGPSTIDSAGPPTPLHAYGRSPALSTRTSFDHGHIRGGGGHQYQHHHHHHHHPGVAAGAGAQDLRGQAEAVEVVEGKEVNLGGGPARSQYNGGGGGGGYHGHAAPEMNGVDVGRIEAGLDTRTTVMLKNVPNKMSDADLRKYISDVVPNSFDFVYLRFDFHSSANVGYAFVNFVNVADLLSFAKARLGVKWNMFCSEKVLQMSYANFQGKEALVEKFKNSCVMEMQDEWVPKIFHSSGPNKGQREPFPPATNPSRARRSQDQRERGLLRGSGLFVGGRGHMSFKHGQ